ncbi:thermonuclease family protein [Desulfuromonas thiophila]|uniref:thermonuclease family protein n=1 Tax=Desulfuromonas thiophila TaxID=57664 RepID=UPI0029F46C1D|nr:thermonuclease family protein [Desulfuromonas thiophila]
MRCVLAYRKDRAKRLPRRPIALLILIGLLLAGLLPLRTQALANDPLIGRVSWIYDGDSLKVASIGKVRLVGIDAPEHNGKGRDRAFLQLGSGSPARLRQVAEDNRRQLIRQVKGRQVRLEVENPSYDRYGRLLAYVWLDNGTLLNAQLLREGRARVYRRFTFARKTEFLQLEEQARRNRRGLWQKP